MGINRVKLIESQMDISERVLLIYNNIADTTVTRSKADEIVRSLKKQQKDLDANHEKLMADGIGEEDYFQKDSYSDTKAKIEEIMKAYKITDEVTFTPQRQHKGSLECPHKPVAEAKAEGKNDQKIVIFMRKIQNLKRKLTDMSFESSISKSQIKYLESSYADIKNAYTNSLSQYFNNDIEEAYENVSAEYFESLGHFERCLVKDEPKIAYRPNLELEKLKIPAFYGDIKEWANFFNVFQDMVHKNEQLSSSEKMLRLRLCLKGEAARLIQHLQISTENYQAAWSLLKQRYDNKRILFTTQWDRIMDQPTINSDNAESVRQLLDTTNECLNAIESLGLKTEDADPFIARVIVRKLDKEGLKLYEQTVKKTREVQKLSDVRDFLDQHFQTLKAVAEKEQGYKNRKQQVFKANHTSTNSKQLFKQCTYCKIPGHTINECRSFKGISTDERHKYAKDSKICYRCLNHKWSETCNSNVKCKKCNNSNHHELLHFENISKKSTMSTKAGLTTVILATAQVRAQAANGGDVLLRALIDQGSQITSISEEAAQILGVQRTKVKTKLHGLGDVVVGESKSKIQIQIRPRFLSNHVEKVDAIVLPTLTTAQPDQSFKFNFKKWENYTFADPLLNKADRIDMVIGGDIFGRIIEKGIRKCNGILAQATKFGWILSGIINQKPPGKITSATTNLERFWELEEEQDEDIRVEDQICLKKFEETTKQDADGRFIVEIPFKDDKTLGDSRKQALARLISMEAKFKKNEKLGNDYRQFIHEYLDLGHMVKANKKMDGKYYLPHQAVVRENKSTTKLRVVFDASAKSSNGKCLNDIMLTGPKLQRDIFDIILKWRLWKVAITADVEKMYRQIKIAEQDQPYHRILWRDNPSDKIEEYELTTVTYGTASAPYLAVRTLFEIADKCLTEKNWLKKIIKEDFYMDDLMTGGDSIEQCIITQREITKHLQSFGFHLRKWLSNCNGITDNIATIGENEVIQIKENEAVKALGLYWDPNQDQFLFKINLKSDQKITKRSVLSQIAQIFDPLGWLSPITVVAKLYMQKLWMQKAGWDEQLSDDLNNEWKLFIQTAGMLEEVRIPRWIGTFMKSKVEIHGFGDASEKAYAAVVYVKIEDSVKLLTAKTKVNPLKNRKTLPKLELCAAHLLAKLLNKVCTIITHNHRVYAWSDSTITLGWIENPKNKDKFIRNRAEEIKKLLPKATWGYVNTKDNPADIASRGISSYKLLNMEIWWNGPKWLSSTEKLQLTTTNEPKATTVLLTSKSGEAFMDNLINRYSSWLKLRRVVAYILRFAKSKKDRQFSHLSAEELQTAALTIVRQTQKQTYAEEIKKLSGREPVNNTSKIANLNPFLDKNGVVRVGGRLRNSELSYNEKHPIILPKSNLTTLIIKDAHHATIHGGNRLTETLIRRQFWIIGLKNSVKHCIRKCPKCIRYKQATATQIMGDLPLVRVTTSSPFTYTGVDYAGPFQMRCSKGRGQKSFKGYVAVFVCLSTKAIHLEAVSELSTDAFLAALRRFFSRRGKSLHIYSDNGTNFVGASRWLDKDFKKAMKQNCEVAPILANDQITWHFIPPAGPHFGGVWEAGVKGMKFHLKRAIGDTKLTFEEMSTVLSQIEASLNSRPLYAINDDNGVDALTPGHFLIGRPLISMPSSQIDDNISTLNKWKLIQKIQRDFWKRWKDEYLHTLQQRNKWKVPEENLKEGDVVILKDENTQPTKWPLAKVMECHPGPDGRVRVVTLKLQNSILKRPIHKLCPMVVSSENSKEKKAEKSESRALATLTSTQPPKKGSDTNILAILLIFLYIMSRNVVKAVGGTTGKNALVGHLSDNTAIYLDSLGKMDVINSNWDLVIYYDLHSYFEQMNMIPNCLQQIKNHCNLLSDFEEACTVISLSLGRHYELIKQNHDLIVYNKRQRRAPLEWIGSIYNMLFGLLDADSEEQIESNLRILLKNQDNIKERLKAQTSIINSTANIINKNIYEVNDQFMKINTQINKFHSEIIKNINRDKMAIQFQMLITQVTILLSECENIQNSIIELLIDLNHGRINPALITPSQLNKELILIREKLPSKLQIPGQTNNNQLRDVYNLMRAHGLIIDRKLVIKAEIPLMQSESSEVYKLIPIPFEHNGRVIKIKLKSKFLIYNFGLHSYFLITEAQLNRCTRSLNNHLICKGKTPWQPALDQICELSPLLKGSQADCQYEETKKVPLWAELFQGNKWIFKVFQNSTLHLDCGSGKTETIRLPAQGILSLKSSCTARHEGTTLSGLQVFKAQSIINPEQDPIATVIHQISEDKITPLQINIINSIKELDKLKRNIEKLSNNELELSNLNFKNHSGHLSLILIVLLTICILIFYFIHKCKSKNRITIKLSGRPQNVHV